MTSTTPEATPVRHSFERRVDEVRPSKMDINFVIMDYLINEGYPAAAKKFAAEANIQQPHGSAEYIQERLEIRNAILSGDIQNAIEKINDFNPDILDLDPSLHFSLLRLQLVELIRPCITSANADITPALTFAQTSLAPRAPTNKTFLSDLEETMALLIFSPEVSLPENLKALLDPDLRQSVASDVNGAILKSEGLRSDSKLKSLVKLRAWAEKKAREQNVELPSELDIWGSDGPMAAQPSRTGDTAMGHDGEPEMEGMVT